MRLLLTGAPGWLGDALLQAMPEHWQISLLVDANLDQKALSAWQCKQSRALLVKRADLGASDTLQGICGEISGGTVIHSAGVIHPRRTSDWYAVNRDGTLALARQARESGVRRFVFISSNAAQGAGENAADLCVESGPCRPRSHYGRSKLEAEVGLQAMHVPGVFDVVIARPCMFYGPPIPARHVDIFRRIIKGRLPLVGHGHYARSLSYIDDLVSGVLLCATHERAPGETFYLCDERPYTTLEIYQAMAAALEVEPRFIRLPQWTATVCHQLDNLAAQAGVYSMPLHLVGEADWHVGCSSEKARRMLGYSTSVDAAEGYRRAIAWCRLKKLL